jgi:phosphoglycerol transferase MdoB-like AlkP superfamily enzyme
MSLRQETLSVLRAWRPLAVFAVAMLVVFTLARVGLVAWQYERVAAAHMLKPVFVEGLRFDFVVLGFLLMPLALLMPLFATSRTGLAVGRPLLIGYLLVCVVAAIFLEVATPAFLAQFDSRPNRLFIEYIGYPKEVGSTLLAGYLLHLIVAAILMTVGTFYVLRRLRAATAGARPLKIVTALVAAFGLFVGGFAAARSTLDHRAVNPSTVAISTDPMVNDLALNSTYTLLYAITEETGEPEGGFRYGEMPEQHALDIVKREMQVAPERFVAGEVPTLHRQDATQPRAKPKNLVIVLEESLGAEFVGALGGKPLTPRLDALAKDGIWFENLYATGTRSVRGLEALITGFTPTPARSVVKLGGSQRDFFTIAQLLKGFGYDTSFIYGGEGQFDNMRRFFMNNGFDFVVDQDDYVNPVFYGSWGVADEDLFKRADEEFAKPRDKPFFSLVFTTSNHSPYEYPEGRIEPYDADPHTVNNAVEYADYALGQFFDRARTRAYWNDTVFLVVADHNSRVYGANLVPVEHFHIPGLILGGGIEPKVYEPVASQIDMPPTLLSMIGISSTHPMIGHDLTRPEFAMGPGRAILQYDGTQAYMVGNKTVILRKHLPPGTFEWDGAKLNPLPDDDALAETAIAHANWASTSYEKRLYRLPGGDKAQQLSAVEPAR